MILNFRALQGALQVHSPSATRQKHFGEQTNLKWKRIKNNTLEFIYKDESIYNSTFCVPLKDS